MGQTIRLFLFGGQIVLSHDLSVQRARGGQFGLGQARRTADAAQIVQAFGPSLRGAIGRGTSVAFVTGQQAGARWQAR